MTAIINNRRMVSAQPFVIHSSDPDVQAYVDAIPAPSIDSDTANAEWGLLVAGLDDGDVAGSAYIVSAESYKRIVTGRFA